MDLTNRTMVERKQFNGRQEDRMEEEATHIMSLEISSKENSKYFCWLMKAIQNF